MSGLAQKKKKTSFAARSGGKTTPIGGKKKGNGRSAPARRKKGLNWPVIVAAGVLLATYAIVVLFNGFHWPGWQEGWDDLKDSARTLLQAVQSAFGQLEADTPDGLVLDPPAGGEVRVHFIDVGQGDCILIEGSGESVLIDAGENDQGDEVLGYLSAAGIEDIDLAVGTHPHSDHIGGMDTVLEGITVGRLMLSDVPDSIVPTTRTYLDLLDAAEETGTEMFYGYPGDQVSICGGTLTVLGPVEDYDDLNDESLVIRFDYGESSFLFTGDMESGAEEDLLASGADIGADVLKVGHHGSNTSSSEEFLRAVGPEIAVIECGEGNDYGHPHLEVLERLEAVSAAVYRTDLDGSVVVTADGSGNYDVSTAEGRP